MILSPDKVVLYAQMMHDNDISSLKLEGLEISIRLKSPVYGKIESPLPRQFTDEELQFAHTEGIDIDG